MAVQTAQLELQTAIYQALAPNGIVDSVLASLGVVGVHHFRAVPQNREFDYITVGDSLETPENTFGRRGYEHHMTLHLWSRNPDTDAATLQVARINELLDQQNLNLSTHALVMSSYERALWIADPDGLTLHVALKYHFYTEE